MKNPILENIKVSMHELQAAVDLPGMKMDENTRSQYSRQSVVVKNQTYYYYPWGLNNRLPNEMIALVRSNGDVGNLLNTKADFLFGAGIGLFQRIGDEANSDSILTPYTKWDAAQWMLDTEVNVAVESAIVNLVQTGNAFLNVSLDSQKQVKLNSIDSLLCRCGKVPDTVGKIDKYLLSGRWDYAYGNKYAAVVPAFNFNKPDSLAESMIHLRRTQPGQYYYGWANWWSLSEWIKLANRIADVYNGSLDTEGNFGLIVRVAEKYFDTILSNTPEKENGDPWSKEELIEAFDMQMDTFLFGAGTNKVIRDLCGINQATNQLEKWLEIEPVKRSFTGDEYIKLYTACIMAFSNGSGILSGLAGVSNGVMNSGGGTEIRLSAEFEQFYRTPRERMLILNVLNRVLLPSVKKQLGLPDGVFFDFKNIVLETLDKNPTGSKTVKSNAGN